MAFPNHSKFSNPNPIQKQTLLDENIYVYVSESIQSLPGVNDRVKPTIIYTYGVKHIFRSEETYDP